MGWNDEFGKEHEKKDNFSDFPEKDISKDNEETVEQNLYETEQVDMADEEEKVLYDRNTSDESKQNIFNQTEQYQSQLESGQPIFNQTGQYQSQLESGQPIFNQTGQYQSQLESGQPVFNQTRQYQQQEFMSGQTYSRRETSNTNGGFAIASFVVALISFLFSCCFGGVLGIVSLILGIISLTRKENGKGFSITGVILSIIAILITILTVILMVIGWVSSEDTELYDDVVSNIEAVSGTGEDIFAGKSFIGIDETEICFDLEDEYVFYQERSEYKDNCYQGTYTYYNGEDAAAYLAKDILTNLKKYKQVDMLEEAFSGVKNCRQDELYCLVLDVEKKIMDGETQDGGEKIVYFGYYQNALLDVINTNNFKEVYYVLSESEHAKDNSNEDKIEKKEEE